MLRARLNATTKSGDSRLIIVSLHVAGVQLPLRALLDSGVTSNISRESCLSMLLSSIRVREGSGQVVVKVGLTGDQTAYRGAKCRFLMRLMAFAAMMISW